MIITRKALARRTFLRGAGAALALPVLDAMTPAMSAAPSPAPSRMIFVFHPNGAIPAQWKPTTEGKNFEFTPTLKPLEPFRENVTILSGLAQVQGNPLGDGGGDHSRAGATWLTGAHPLRSETENYVGISADQIAAQALGEETQFSSLELTLESPGLGGACDGHYSCALTNTVSWKNPTTPLPAEASPRLVFERLFGASDSTSPTVRQARLKEQRSLLDYVIGSIDRLQTNLGPRDRVKLSNYLDSIRDIEHRIEKAEQQNSEMRLPEMERPAGTPSAFEDHAKLLIDLQTIALQADMTRVITFMFGRAQSNRPYPNIGISDGHHSLTHHRNDPELVEKVGQIDQYLASIFAYYVEKLKTTSDGHGGSLLDDTMMCYGSSLGDGNIHEHTNLPIALVAGNRHFEGNRHLVYQQGAPLNNLFLSMFAKANVPCEGFGDSTGLLPRV
jgi:hypothetical protein